MWDDEFWAKWSAIGSWAPQISTSALTALLWAKVWDTEGKWQCQGHWGDQLFLGLHFAECVPAGDSPGLIKILTLSQLWTCEDRTAADSLHTDPWLKQLCSQDGTQH